MRSTQPSAESTRYKVQCIAAAAGTTNSADARAPSRMSLHFSDGGEESSRQSITRHQHLLQPIQRSSCWHSHQAACRPQTGLHSHHSITRRTPVFSTRSKHHQSGHIKSTGANQLKADTCRQGRSRCTGRCQRTNTSGHRGNWTSSQNATYAGLAGQDNARTGGTQAAEQAP